MKRWWSRWDGEMGQADPCPVNRPGLYELWNGMRVAIHRIGASAVEAQVPTRTGRMRTLHWDARTGRVLSKLHPPHYNIRRRLPWVNPDGTYNHPTEQWEETFDDKGRIRIRDRRPRRLHPSVP